jgi:deoxyribose-phosphate aldolase
MEMKQKILKELNRMIDVSAVRADSTMAEVEEMIRVVREYGCICASPMPFITKYVVDRLRDREDIVVTGVVSFPGGAETIATKVFTAKEMISVGCRELDMVTNISAMKSGNYDLYYNDIRAVVEAAGDVPVKTILEICYLTDDEICRASELAVKAGAAYIKTGTGWGPKPTTVETVALIRKTIGNAAKIKAAGGVSDLDILLKMIDAGCDRFGVGVRTAEKIFIQREERLRMEE